MEKKHKQYIILGILFILACLLWLFLTIGHFEYNKSFCQAMLDTNEIAWIRQDLTYNIDYCCKVVNVTLMGCYQVKYDKPGFFKRLSSFVKKIAGKNVYTDY